MNSNERPTKKFLASYFHDDAWWSTFIFAYDFEDAEVRCKKLNMQLAGEYIATIPAVSGDWLPSLICWIRNKLSSA